VINKYSNSDKQVLSIVINSDKQVCLYSGGFILGGGAYVWNEVSTSTYVGWAYTQGGL
jgi:hypothetical protein